MANGSWKGSRKSKLETTLIMIVSVVGAAAFGVISLVAT